MKMPKIHKIRKVKGKNKDWGKMKKTKRLLLQTKTIKNMRMRRRRNNNKNNLIQWRINQRVNNILKNGKTLSMKSEMISMRMSPEERPKKRTEEEK